MQQAVALFLDRLFAALDADGLDVSAFELDHVCYRVADQQSYEVVCAQLAAKGELLSATLIAGRPISTFQLHAPLVYRERRIGVIEVPAPKPGSPYPEGFEHAEFVVPEDLRTFIARHPSLAWDLSDLDKPINGDVRLRYDGFSVKFHRQALAYVIAHLDPR
ncbi:MAG TPA: VOC family protein [Flavobacteriales bacterium]|jgi:hypothetical protein|nr:VOC family protein [Flavobacteriales bacterium]